ncbi:hypothetical protein Tco_1335685 [Tanacetum coccineum]
MEVGYKFLVEHPLDCQEKGYLVVEKVWFLKKKEKNFVLIQKSMKLFLEWKMCLWWVEICRAHLVEKEMMILIWVKKGWMKKLEWKPWMVLEVKKRKKMMEKNKEGAGEREFKELQNYYVLIQNGACGEMQEKQVS